LVSTRSGSTITSKSILGLPFRFVPFVSFPSPFVGALSFPSVSLFLFPKRERKPPARPHSVYVCFVITSTLFCTYEKEGKKNNKIRRKNERPNKEIHINLWHSPSRSLHLQLVCVLKFLKNSCFHRKGIFISMVYF